LSSDDFLSTIDDGLSAKGLAEALFPRTRLAVLRELVKAEGQGLHLRELERRTRLNSRGILRELRSLKEAGILVSHRTGNQVIYRLNVDCPIYPELKNLLLKTAALADVLRAALSPYAGRIVYAYVYGSFASGEATWESDIDLMIVGDVDLQELAGPLRKAAQTLGREINPTLYRPEEYQAQLKKTGSFVSKVHQGPRIDVLKRSP